MSRDKLKRFDTGISNRQEMAEKILSTAAKRSLDLSILEQGVGVLADKLSIDRKRVRKGSLEGEEGPGRLDVIVLRAKNETTGKFEDFGFFPDTEAGSKNLVDAYMNLALLAKEKEVDTKEALRLLKKEEAELASFITPEYDKKLAELDLKVMKNELADIKARRKSIKKEERNTAKINDVHEKLNHDKTKLLAEETESAFLNYGEVQLSVLLAQLDKFGKEMKSINQQLDSGSVDATSYEVTSFLPGMYPRLLFILGGISVEIEEQMHDTFWDDNKKVRIENEMYEILNSAGIPTSGTKGLGVKELLNPFTIFHMMNGPKMKRRFKKEIKTVYQAYRQGKITYPQAIAVIQASHMEDKRVKKVMKDKLYLSYVDSWSAAEVHGDGFTGPTFLPEYVDPYDKGKKTARRYGARRRPGRGPKRVEKGGVVSPDKIKPSRGEVAKARSSWYTTKEGLHVLEDYNKSNLYELIDLYHSDDIISGNKRDALEYTLLNKIMSSGALDPTATKSGIDYYTSFEHNVLRLSGPDYGYADYDQGINVFWKLMQEQFIDDSFLGDLDERYTNALISNKAKERVKSADKDGYLYPFAPLLDDKDEDGILVNAFIDTMAKRSGISAMKLANMFAHYDQDYAEPASFIESMSEEKLGDASLLKTIQYQGIPGAINRGLNALVGEGYISANFAGGVNKLTGTVLGGAKLGTIIVAGVKGVKGLWNGLQWGWHSLFSGEEGGNPKADTAWGNMTKNWGMKSGALKWFAINQGVKIAEDPDGYWERATDSNNILWGNVLGFLNPSLKDQRDAENMKKAGIFERDHSKLDLFEETIGGKYKISKMLSGKILIPGKTKNSVVVNPERFESAFPSVAGLYITDHGRKMVSDMIDIINDYLTHDMGMTWSELNALAKTNGNMTLLDAKKVIREEEITYFEEKNEFDEEIDAIPDIVDKSMARSKLAGLEGDALDEAISTLVFVATQREKLEPTSVEDAIVEQGLFGKGVYISEYDDDGVEEKTLVDSSIFAKHFMENMESISDTTGTSAIDWLDGRLSAIEDGVRSKSESEITALLEGYLKVLSSLTMLTKPGKPMTTMTFQNSSGVDTNLRGGDGESLASYFIGDGTGFGGLSHTTVSKIGCTDGGTTRGKHMTVEWDKVADE